MRIAAVVIVVAACGRIDFAPGGAGSDAGVDAVDAADAVAIDACTAFGAWTAPQVIGELSVTGAIDYGPALSPDGTEIVFHSDRAGGSGSFDLYLARRATVDVPFDAPQRLVALATSARDESGDFSTDALTLYYDSLGSGTDTPYFATRADHGALFGDPVQLPALGDLEGVTVTADGAELFAYARAANMLARATSFTTATPAIELLAQFPTGSGYPSLTPDALTMYYTKGGNIWRASRPDRASPFAIDAMEATLSTAHESDVDIRRDGLEILFSSDRSGDNDLYRATRTCP